MFIQLSGCASNIKNKGLLEYQLKKNCFTKPENVQTSLKVTSKFNFPGITPTWNAFTWASRWGQLLQTTCLDSC